MRTYPPCPGGKPGWSFAFPMRRWTVRLSNAFLAPLTRLTKPVRGVRLKRLAIARPDGGTIGLTFFEPKGIGPDAPCLVYFHGGAFALKAAPLHVRLASQYARQTPCKVALVDYRLAPRHPFPAGLNDCLTAAAFIREHAEALGVDKQRVALGGDSAGGALAVAVSLALRDGGEENACFLLLVYPVADARQASDSMKELANVPLWNAAATKKMWEFYLGGGAPLPRAYASPLEAESFAGLPDAYVEVSQFDCLRDEGIALARALQSGGARVELNETRGTTHGFETICGRRIVAEAVERRSRVLRAGFYGAFSVPIRQNCAEKAGCAGEETGETNG